MAPFTILLVFMLSWNPLHCQYNYLCDFNSSFTSNNRGTWNFDSNACTITQTGSYNTVWGAVAWLGGNTNTLLWTDYVIEAVINTAQTPIGNGYVGIIFRAQDIANTAQYGKYYAATFGFGALFDVANLRYKSSTTYDKLDENSNSISENQDYTLKIEVVGNSFAVYVNNALQFTTIDNTYTFGSIGVRATYAVTTFKSLNITFPTHMPTTAIPTTLMPTTTIPTTSNPTTSVPSTFTPTTNTPTTFIPTTTKPTTFSPTTKEPTSKPSTMKPTTYIPTMTQTTMTVTTTMMDTKSPQIDTDNFWDDSVLIAAIISAAVFILCIAFIGYCCYREKSRNRIKSQEIKLEMEKINQLSVSAQSPVGSVSDQTFIAKATNTKMKAQIIEDEDDAMYGIVTDNEKTLNDGLHSEGLHGSTVDESDAESSNDDMYKTGGTVGNKKGFYTTAISDYIANDEDQLSLKQGVVVFVITEYMTESGWWYGIDENGLDGWIPSNYLNECDAMEQKQLEQHERLHTDLMNKSYNNIKKNDTVNVVNMNKYLKILPPRIPPVIVTYGQVNKDADDMSFDEDLDSNNETVGKITNR